MTTFCLDCAAYNTHGSLLENVTRAAADAPAAAAQPSTASLASIAATVSAAHFYALPSILTFGLVFSAFNAACMTKSCSGRGSSDCFLAALAVQSLGSTLLAVILHAPSYAELVPWYPRVVALASGLHDWLGCAYTWTLLVMCSERRLTVKRMRHGQAYCGCLQAGLAVLMVAIVTLVAGLPQLWIKEVQATVEPVNSRLGTNATVLRIVNSPAGMRPEYAILYQFFRDLSAVLIPGPLLAAIVCQLLCCSGKYNRQQQQQQQQQGQSGKPDSADEAQHAAAAIAAAVSPSDRTLQPRLLHRQQQQIQANRMGITLGCCHLMLSFPMLTLLLLWGHRPGWLPADAFKPLYQLFSLPYYLYYPVAFLLHACFLADYRARMRRLFCSESCQYTTYVVE